MFIINNGHANNNVTSRHAFYFGADAIYSSIKFKNNYGNNMFSKDAKGVNVFIVAMFTNTIGMEIGYGIEQKQKKSRIIYSPEYIAGWSITNIWNNALLKSEIKQQYPYLGIVLNSKISDKCYASTLFGVSRYNIHAKYNMLEPRFLLGYTVTFSKTKIVPTARFSIAYKLANNFAIRTFATWKHTSKVTIKSNDVVDGNLIKLKDLYNAGIGISYDII